MIDGQRIAFVTGSQSGIGAAVAARLALAGWRIARFDRAAEDDPARWSFAGSTIDDDHLRDAIVRVHDEGGRLDAVICSAGHNEHLPFTFITEAAWVSMFNVHVHSAAVVIQTALPLVAKTKGSITLVGSELGFSGGDDNAHYATAKGAMLGLVEGWRETAGRNGVSLNLVAPGPTDTPMLHGGSQSDIGATTPLHRLARPAEIAAAVTLLCLNYSGAPGTIMSPNAGTVMM
jgi:NAD(P)-dependent dehydrogenase (short-subunit alcohol dehydrogenase family)